MSILEPPQQQNGDVSIVAATTQFLRAHWFRFSIISAALLVPCFWHRRIEACDLPSHVYNAWLVELIKAGQAPGLWLARRWDNVLFDYSLSLLGSFTGWGAAEKIATSGAVLIYFWGAFALVCAMTRRLPWFILPCLAIFAYGWTFEMGFMNFNISVGLAFFALAILIRGRGWERWLAVILVPPMLLAHPLGMIVFGAIGSYAVLAERVLPRQRLYLFVAPIFILAGIHLLIRFHYPAGNVTWGRAPRYIHDGFDQLLLYGPQYLLPARLLRAFSCACLLLDAVRRRRTLRWWIPYLLSTELYFIILMGIVLLPTDLDSRLLHQIGFLNERMTAVMAIFACCLMGTMKPQKLHLIGFSAMAAFFFFYLYNDTGTISRMEDQMDGLVRNLPPGQRVVAAIETFPSSIVGTSHIIDRTCIGHCFSYDNYEPQVAQFRVRAHAGNPYVLTDRPTTWDALGEYYVVQREDLPLFGIERCGLGDDTLCVREPALGNKIAVGYKANRTWLARFGGTSLLFDLLLTSILAAALSMGQRLISSHKRAAAK